MPTVETYHDLKVWQTAINLVERSYGLTKFFPREERFGLTSQLRRAAISIPSNIAEGACRHTTNAFINHVSIALGSHAEFDTCVEIAFRLGFLSPSGRSELANISGTTGRLLNGLLRSLQAKTARR